MRKIYFILFLLLSIHLIILYRLQFTVWPEMVSFPYLINHGFILYKDAIHAYPPLLVSVLAILNTIFGYGAWILKVFAWTFLLLNDVLIFLIIKKLTKKNNLAFLGLVFYIFTQPFLEGNMVWPDIIIVTPLLFSFYYLLEKKYLRVGIFLAIALLIKQTAIFFILGSIIFIFWERQQKKVLALTIGLSIVLLPFILWLVINKNFVDFVNWTIIYPSTFWTKFPGYVDLNFPKKELFVLLVPLLVLLTKLPKKIYIIFLIAAIAGVYPRFSFFHFQAALSFLVILYAFALSNIKNSKLIYLILLIPLIIFYLRSGSIIYGGNRFWDEDKILSEKITRQTVMNKPIYLLGLNSDLYAISDKLPPKPWLDNFGWYLEIPGVQENVIKGFKDNPPEEIFWKTPVEGNWFDLGTYQPKEITNWIKSNYNRKQEVEREIWLWEKK